MINDKGEFYVNLLTVRSMKRLSHSVPVTHLIKDSDGKPHGIRTQAGGWSMVYLLPPDHDELKSFTQERIEEEITSGVKESKADSTDARQKRLKSAEKKPEKIKISSTGYRRNPDVVAEVLLRANGICERCKRDAPFLRASDGSQYLEIHHKKPLAEEGEDTVGNALALCPNCHREVHFG